jgi:hypothetical protein
MGAPLNDVFPNSQLWPLVGEMGAMIDRMLVVSKPRVGLYNQF